MMCSEDIMDVSSSMKRAYEPLMREYRHSRVTLVLAWVSLVLVLICHRTSSSFPGVVTQRFQPLHLGTQMGLVSP